MPLARLFAVAAVVLHPLAAYADHAPAGHSVKGESFDEGPRQRARIMGGTGGCHLAVTTGLADAQRFFDQGVGQLHGFWYYEAERSFRQAAALDPDCAMAYWGMAVANMHNQKRAAGFIKRAVELMPKASPRERQWISGYSDYFSDTGREKDRRRGLVRELEAIAVDHPEEVEAKAFLAFHLWDNAEAGRIPNPSKLAVHSLINDVLSKNPAHPVHHYVIHLWDYDKPARALASAARCGQTAPTVAHMWHMPGHTFTGLKRYADAAWQQEAAARADHRYMMRDRVLPDQIHNYTHNGQWLAESLAAVGRARDAVAVAKNLAALPRHPRYNSFGSPAAEGAGGHGSAAEGRRRLVETLTQYELWSELIGLADTSYLDPTDASAEQTARLAALALAHFSAGDPVRGREYMASLDKWVADGHAMTTSTAGVTGGLAFARRERDQVASVDNALSELRVLDALARKETAKALELLGRAGGLPNDRLARLWLAAGDRKKAETAARDGYAAGDGRVLPLAHLIDVLERCGKNAEARELFPELRVLAADADLDTPVMKRLAPVAKGMALPADWRTRRVPSADIGIRPPLDTLGPLHWAPSAAPNWQLPGAGGTRTLEEYRGRPVVVIMYLGVGCIHCVDQLNAFAPLKGKFGEAGIDIVAIGTDAADETAAAAIRGAGKGPPFPVLADPNFKAFKSYGAFDDFEGRPLHGTFLIDGRGRIRWWDVGPEPFADAKFLLAEARRLLALPDPATAEADRAEWWSLVGRRLFAMLPLGLVNRQHGKHASSGDTCFPAGSCYDLRND